MLLRPTTTKTALGLSLLLMTHPSGYSNWVSPQLTGQVPVHWKGTWMLVVSLRGRFWFSLKDFRIESQKPAPRPYWSPLGDLPAPIQTSYFIGPYNLHYLLFSVIGALLCHHPYCFPSQSQTLFGIGAGRPLLGQYCSDKHPRDF